VCGSEEQFPCAGKHIGVCVRKGSIFPYAEKYTVGVCVRKGSIFPCAEKHTV
jgi:hypothetical protein